MPKLRRDAGIRRVLEHAPQLAIFDFPRDLRTELKIEPLIINAPTLISLHVNAVIGTRDQLIEIPLPRFEIDVSHSNQWNAIPAIGAHRPVAALIDLRRGLARGEIPHEDAVLDDWRDLRGHSLIIIAEGP